MNEAEEPKPAAPKPVKRPIEPGKVFDVRRPGSVNASATAKPIIVGHKPQVRDSVLVNENAKKPMLETAQKVDIKPAEAEKPAAAAPSNPETPPELANIAAELAKVSEEKPKSDAVEKEPIQAEPVVKAGIAEQTPAPETDAHDGASADTDKIEVKPFFESKKDEAESSPTAGKPAEPVEAKSMAESASKAEVVTSSQDPPSLTEQIPELEQTKRGGALDMAKITKEELAEANAALAEDKNSAPSVDPHSIVVSKSPGPSMLTFLLWIVGVIVCLVVIGDILLDSGVIYSSVPIPHTHIFTK